MSDITSLADSLFAEFGALALGWIGFAMLLWANITLSRALVRNYSVSIEAATATARALSLLAEKMDRLMERSNA